MILLFIIAIVLRYLYMMPVQQPEEQEGSKPSCHAARYEQDYK